MVRWLIVRRTRHHRMQCLFTVNAKAVMNIHKWDMRWGLMDIGRWWHGVVNFNNSEIRLPFGNAGYKIQHHSIFNKIKNTSGHIVGIQITGFIGILSLHFTFAVHLREVNCWTTWTASNITYVMCSKRFGQRFRSDLNISILGECCMCAGTCDQWIIARKTKSFSANFVLVVTRFRLTQSFERRILVGTFSSNRLVSDVGPIPFTSLYASAHVYRLRYTSSHSTFNSSCKLVAE